MPRSARRGLIPSLIQVLIAVLLSGAAQAVEPLSSCTAPGYRQFDFWAGDWQVKSAGGTVVLGENHIRKILAGCALHEHWRGRSGRRGESLSHYDRDSGRWYQTWVDQGGENLRLEGGLQGPAMVLQGEQHKAGQTSLERITWTPLADGRVRQFWETSIDGGVSWQSSFDGYYQRLKAKPRR